MIKPIHTRTLSATVLSLSLALPIAAQTSGQSAGQSFEIENLRLGVPTEQAVESLRASGYDSAEPSSDASEFRKQVQGDYNRSLSMSYQDDVVSQIHLTIEIPTARQTIDDKLSTVSDVVALYGEPDACTTTRGERSDCIWTRYFDDHAEVLEWRAATLSEGAVLRLERHEYGPGFARPDEVDSSR